MYTHPIEEDGISADNMDTKPTIETVLERINALGESLSKQINSVKDELNDRIDSSKNELDAKVTSLQSQIGEIRVILRDFSFKIDALNKNFLQLQANQIDLRERVENLESKAS